jgi:hypothetical protein
MCQYFSGILTKDGEVYWLKENPCDHEAIIQKHQLKDTKLQSRDWIRFEITPKNYEKLLKLKTRDQLTRDLFQFQWDMQGELPSWLEKNCATYIANCWKAAEDSWKIHLLFGEETIQKMAGNDYIHLMWGNSQVNAMWGNSQVNMMRDNSQVNTMWDNSQVNTMWDNSQVNTMYDFAVAIKSGIMYTSKTVEIVKAGCVKTESEAKQ